MNKFLVVLLLLLSNLAFGTKSIEDAPYNAKGFYTGTEYFGKLMIVPDQANKVSKIIYTGTGLGPFKDDWKDVVQFVGFRNHLNLESYPVSGVTNGNYWPGMLSCRYSTVTKVISPTEIEVNFVYNGGNIASPVTQTNASGYFFIDDRAAFKAAFEDAAANNPDGIITLDPAKTYVCKGGWNTIVNKNITLRSATPPQRSRIKISMEDLFNVNETATGQAGSNKAAITETFGSLDFFRFDNNGNFDVSIENIDILPPHYGVKSAEWSLFKSYLFYTPPKDYLDPTIYTTGKRQLINCNTEVEKLLPGQPTDASFMMPYFAGGVGGGKLNPAGTDVELYEEYLMHNCTYTATEVHGLKAEKRNGNILRIQNSIASASPKTSQGIWPGTRIKITAPSAPSTDPRKRVVTILSPEPTVFQLSNEYWLGGGAHVNYVFYDQRRNQFITVTDALNRSWKIYISNSGSFFRDYIPAPLPAEQYNVFIPKAAFVNSKQFLINEEIPEVGVTKIKIDGTKNFKILAYDGDASKDNYRFQIEDVGLQALTTYPFVRGTGEDPSHPKYNDYKLHNSELSTSYSSPDCDELTYSYIDNNDQTITYTVKVLKRYRVSVASSLSQSVKKGCWVIELDNPVTIANPEFTVSKSVTQFVLTSGETTATIQTYVNANYTTLPIITNYFGYSSQNLNFQFQNSTIGGYLRGTENTGVDNTKTNTPAYLLPRTKEITNCFLDNYANIQDLFHGKGLYYRM